MGVIGVGHSIGATVTLRAAIRQPERFRALILLDPAFFRPHFILLWNIIKKLGLGQRLGSEWQRNGHGAERYQDPSPS